MNEQLTDPWNELLESLRGRLRFHFGTSPATDLSFDVVQQESILTTPAFRLTCIGETRDGEDRLFCDLTGTPTDHELAKLGAVDRVLDGALVAGLRTRAHMRVAREIEQR